MTRAIVLDTETTGLDPSAGDRLVEVAAIELIDDKPTGLVFHRLVNPGRPIPADATADHGLSDADVRDAPVFAEIWSDLDAFCGPSPIIAHNAKFDSGFLDAECRLAGLPLIGARWIDTLAMFREQHGFAAATLDAMLRRWDIRNTRDGKHDALGDCRLLAACWIHLTGGHQRTLTLDAPQAAIASYAPPFARTPRVIVPSQADLAAHSIFLAKIKNNLW